MLKPTLVSTSKTYYTLLINNCIFLFGQILFLDYYDLLIFVGLDGYTPQKDRFCYQEDGETYGRMNATNLTSAEEECSANTNCLLFTDWCGRGDTSFGVFCQYRHIHVSVTQQRQRVLLYYT